MKVNLELNEADQVRDLGLTVGDVVQAKTANGEDRLILLWVGETRVVWRRQYRRHLPNTKWEDFGEVTNYNDFHSLNREWRKVTSEEIEGEKLRDLCRSAYKIVDSVKGPPELLSNLAAAASGDPLPHDPESGLPWTPPIGGPEIVRVKEQGNLELSPICRDLLRALTDHSRTRSSFESESFVNDLIPRAKAALEASVFTKENSNGFFTLVFKNLSQEEIPALTSHPKLSYAGVGHAFYERDEIKRELDRLIPF